jgi:hypothetical protein
MKRSLAFLLAMFACAAGSAACGDSTGATSPSSSSSTPTTEFYAGSLAPLDSGFYSFSVATAGNVSVSLASVTADNGAPLAIPLSVGLGTPAGPGCAVASAVEIAPALTAQITESSPAGIRCVEIHDSGILTATVNCVVRIVHP